MNRDINRQIFDRFPRLEGERLLFRQILPDDTERMFFLRTHREVMRYMDTPDLESLDASRELIKTIGESFRKGMGINWGIEEKESGAFIGYFGFWRILVSHCRGEMGYALDPLYWGRGYMRETLNIMIPFAFNRLRLHSIEANVNPANRRSIRLLEKAGFQREAYFRENILFEGAFRDSVIYSLLETDDVCLLEDTLSSSPK